jgi:hypothetical protein
MWTDFKNWFAENETLVANITIVSFIIFGLCLLAIPFVVVRLPANHFTRPEREIWSLMKTGPLGWIWLVLRNVLGLLMVIVGVPMIPLPGPGLVCIMLGLALVQLPGRRWLEAKLIRMPMIHKSMNALRAKYHAPPLELPE